MKERLLTLFLSVFFIAFGAGCGRLFYLIKNLNADVSTGPPVLRMPRPIVRGRAVSILLFGPRAGLFILYQNSGPAPKVGARLLALFGAELRRPIDARGRDHQEGQRRDRAYRDYKARIAAVEEGVREED